MKLTTIVALLALIVVGCARDPVTPSNISDESHKLKPASDADSRPYRLWGEYSIYINGTHDQVEVVPKRQPRFHLNALKFLEGNPCYDCLKVLSLKNNGDSTVDLTVKITHPFPGLPQLTGFDVKGIIMFDGSWVKEGYQYYPPYPEPFRVSWRKLGDPQLMNADGYTIRWSPWYESGSELPIFNYYHGKFATGTPTANVNGYLNFYTHENRHMFYHYGSVNRTYKIWLPPGKPVVATYAVEACWEPPLVTPVMNPAEDFPITANQPEAYELKFVLNHGEPITDPVFCQSANQWTENWRCAYGLKKQWGGHTAKGVALYSTCYGSNGWGPPPCGDEWPDTYCWGQYVVQNCYIGDHIGVAINYGGTGMIKNQFAYTVYEFTLDF